MTPKPSLPLEPETIRLLRLQNKVAPPVHSIVLTYIDTLRAQYAELLVKCEGMERDTFESAARLVELIGYDWRDGGNRQKQYAAEYLANAIRGKAIAATGGRDG